jgi:hypothetical protein
MSASHGLRFDGSRFWVMHRRQEYGPFDYQWSSDLRGLEMIYQGEKFGEHCSENQIYADLWWCKGCASTGTRDSPIRAATAALREAAASMPATALDSARTHCIGCDNCARVGKLNERSIPTGHSPWALGNVMLLT